MSTEAPTPQVVHKKSWTSFLWKYSWYRKWKAYRKRKSVEKAKWKADSSSETYEVSSDVMQREEDRFRRLLEERNRRYEERLKQQAIDDEIFLLAKNEADTDTARSDELFAEYKADPKKFVRQDGSKLDDTVIMFLAREQHIEEITVRIKNERNSKKS